MLRLENSKRYTQVLDDRLYMGETEHRGMETRYKTVKVIVDQNNSDRNTIYS